MIMIGELRDLTMNRDGRQNVTVTVSSDFREEYDHLKGKPIRVEIKKYSKQRSLDANNFCWALCTEIGNALKPPLPKEDVYRRAIRQVGEYEPLPIKEEAVETFQNRWAKGGVGWFAEIIDNSKLPGYKLVFAYYGSSTYDTKAMSRLIDYLVDEMEQMGLSIPLGKEEQERLLDAWAFR